MPDNMNYTLLLYHRLPVFPHEKGAFRPYRAGDS